MKIPRFDDPLMMPGTGEGPEERFAHAEPLLSTPGAAYVLRRGIPLHVADEAGVRFDPDMNGRPAVVALMIDRDGVGMSLHGRYLHSARGQNKMLTIGPGGGVASVLDGWRADPLIIVEGLFDALSLAACGFACVATVGRWAPWLPEVASGRRVWLAFDAGRPGDHSAAHYAKLLSGAGVQRLQPPARNKDWNTALVKRGVAFVRKYLQVATSTHDCMTV
jgi:hypothetical protein